MRGRDSMLMFGLVALGVALLVAIWLLLISVISP